MPGMMDTILNLGLNQQTLQGLIAQTGNERFGYDAYRRFIQLFGKVALGVPDEPFDEAFDEIKRDAGVKADVALNAEHLKEASRRFLDVVLQHTGKPFPEDVYEQLEIAIKRCSTHGWASGRWTTGANSTSPRTWPTAPPSTWWPWCSAIWATIAPPAWVSPATPAPAKTKCSANICQRPGRGRGGGIRTPKPVQEMEKEMPDLYRQLVDLRNKLEGHYQEVQDYEYTIEKGVLYCLQTRNGKMNAAAMVRSSVEMFEEGLISKEQALLRVNPEQLEQLLHPGLDPSTSKRRWPRACRPRPVPPAAVAYSTRIRR